MCFINEKGWETAKVAAEDIIVYKGLNRSKDGILSSPYRLRTKWTARSICKIKRDFITFGKPYNINEGFHSCKNAVQATRHTARVYKFCIPAGSLYWENHNEYVSDTIILVKKTSIRLPK